MLLNLNKMRLMRQAEHTFSFRLQLISGSVTYLSIIFTSFFLQGFEFCKFLVVGNTEIKNRRQREREFFFAVIAFLSSKPKKQNDRQN